MKNISFKRNFRNQNIELICSVLDIGIHVLLIGGDSSHIGAVSYASREMEIQSIYVEKHKESIISEKWAKEIANDFLLPVTVNCGIHYENISTAEIRELVELCDVMLAELKVRLLNRLNNK